MSRGEDGYYQFANAAGARGELLTAVRSERAPRRGSSVEDGIQSRGTRENAARGKATGQRKRRANSGQLLTQYSHLSSQSGDGSMPSIHNPRPHLSLSFLELGRNAAAVDLLLLEDDLQTLGLSYGAPSKIVHSNCSSCKALEREIWSLRQSLRVQKRMDAFIKEYEMRFQRFRESSFGEERLRMRIVQLEQIVGALIRRLEEQNGEP